MATFITNETSANKHPNRAPFFMKLDIELIRYRDSRQMEHFFDNLFTAKWNFKFKGKIIFFQ